jgi:cytochrome c553
VYENILARVAPVETLRPRCEKASSMMRPLLTGAAAMAGLSGLMLVALWPEASWGYAAFGRVPYVSDAAPFCAGCHSSTDTAYHPELPAEDAQKQLFTEKHYNALEKGGRKYRMFETEERQNLLERAKKVDANSSVSLEAPASAAPGETISVTVSTKGGIGPQIGIMLVDEPIRYQARPIQGAGWFIVGAPVVIGPNGPQTTWLDRRYNKAAINLNFVLIYDVAAAPERDIYPAAKVTYKLRAPRDAGEYSITAAFLYGTADPDEMKTGKYVSPPGGGGAPSGRIQFSNVAKVRVQ